MLKNKFLKHTVAVFAVLTMLLTVNTFVFADVNGFFADVDGKYVEISYDVPVKGFGTLVYVLDTKVQSTDVIDEAFLKEHLVYQTLTFNNTISFTLPEAETKLYTVIFGGPDFSGDKMGRLEYIYTVTQEETDYALDAIKGSSDAGIYDALELYNDQIYSVDISDFEDNKLLVAEVFEALDYTSNLNSREDVKLFIEKVKMVRDFKDMTSSEMVDAIKENSALFGLEDADETEISSVSGIIGALHDAGESLDTLSDIKLVATRADAVYKFNTASNDERLNVVRDFGEIFGIEVDEDDVEKVTEREINKILGANEIKKPEDLEDIYTDAMDKLLKEADDDDDDDSGSSGDGRRGSGGGGGGGVYVPTPTIEPEKLDEIRGSEKLYNDIDGYKWADEAIKMLNTKGIMTGDGSGLFRPADAISREEFVKIVVVGFGFDTYDGESAFSDVADDAWYTPYVMGANRSGLVSGMGEGLFGAGNSISRQDAAVIIARACELKYKEYEEVKAFVEFADYSDISEYAHYAVSYLGKSGILNGYEDGTFKPQGTITRAEAAKLIYGCIK